MITRSRNAAGSINPLRAKSIIRVAMISRPFSSPAETCKAMQVSSKALDWVSLTRHLAHGSCCLRTRGRLAKKETYGAHSDVYQALGKPESYYPVQTGSGDYATVVSRLIAIFAETSEQDELATYRDLINADRDVIRVRSFGGDDDGSVRIDAGVEMVVQARQMLLAAACAARSPQPLFRAGASKEASDYMSRVRLGQTEHGSFVVALLAPVPPVLERNYPESVWFR